MDATAENRLISHVTQQQTPQSVPSRWAMLSPVSWVAADERAAPDGVRLVRHA